MVAERDDEELFDEAVTVIVALLDPELLLTLHHDWLLLIVHDVLEEIVKVLLSDELEKEMLLLFTVSVTETPFW